MNGQVIKGTKNWVVSVEGGLTKHPTLTGDVTIGTRVQKPIGNPNGPDETVWYVKDKGTLNRTNASIKSLPPATSQFYDKILAHENEHVNQWNQGNWSGYWTVVGSGHLSYYPRLENLISRTSEEHLRKEIQKARAIYDDHMRRLIALSAANREAGAHAVSDPIPPNYRISNLHPE
ncbi:MAG: hypothetical protein JNK37_19375 [Verrucomicrobiales bacterium]|nr:hypothetical protein [Verrucomicrobiales bacterium]